jgi:hypothetical protein
VRTAPKKKLSFDSLSPEAREIVLEKVVAGRRKPRQWFRLLRELAAFDEAGDPRRKRLAALAPILGIAAFISLLLSILVTWYALVVSVPCTGTAIWAYLRYRHWKKIDLDNDFRESLLPFLQIIAPDIDPTRPMKLLLDLAGPAEDKVIDRRELPPGRFKKVVRTTYHDPWCRLNMPLADGTRLLLTLKNFHVTVKRQWKNQRGKLKTKLKWSKVVTVKAGLIPNATAVEVDLDRVRALSRAERLTVVKRNRVQAVMLTKKYKAKGVGEQPEDALVGEELLRLFFLLGSTLKAAGVGS